MRQEPLVRAIAAALMLLERSDDDQIDPDTAVQGMESIAYELLKLSGEDREQFIELVGKIADAEKNPEDANFIRDIPQNVGMLES